MEQRFVRQCLADASDAEQDAIRDRFERSCHRLAVHPEAGHMVVHERDGRPDATISFLSLHQGTWWGHQIGLGDTLSGREPATVQARFEALQRVYGHGFGATLRQPTMDRVAGYCTASERWLIDTHHKFVAEHNAGHLSADPDAVNLPLRMFHVDIDEAPRDRRAADGSAGSTRFAAAPTASSAPVTTLLREIARPGSPCFRPPVYREALSLTTADPTLEHARAQLEGVWPDHRFQREFFVARRGDDGAPAAIAVADIAPQGAGVLGLFNVVHIYLLQELDNSDEQAARAALLDAAIAWYRDAGETSFSYALEDDDATRQLGDLVDAANHRRPGERFPRPPQTAVPPHVAALAAMGGRVHQLGLGFMWIVRRPLIDRFVGFVRDYTSAAIARCNASADQAERRASTGPRRAPPPVAATIAV